MLYRPSCLCLIISVSAQVRVRPVLRAVLNRLMYFGPWESPFTHVHGSVRFSLSRYATENEVDLVLEKMPGIIQRLRDISPFSADSEAVCATK